MTERATALVNEHLKERPESRLPDIYKLLYQSCMGPGHAMTNCANASTWLMQEWESIAENSEEELYENISLHYPIYRINLRLAKARNIEPSKILDSFVALANEFPKKPEVLVSVWEIVSGKIKAGKIILPDGDEIDEFNKFIIEKKYPPMHHSREYSDVYRPAYRLVGSEI